MTDDALLGAAERIADGEMVDWASITATLNSEQDRALADELALLQQIAAGHRQLHQVLPASADTPSQLVPDRARWAHLDLLNVVGRGSYGIVYRAWDTRLERLVALKLFHGAANPETVMQEGRMLARVRDEHVVTVFGADVVDGVAGIWMELVHGQTLDLIVRKSGAFAPGEAAAIGGDVARALAAVHAAGLLHCDVKAQNVVRETTGRVVLMDLGAGRLAPEMRDDSDQLSDIAGTPRYMAPELFAAGAAPTKATDIYSLGVLIYFLVAGEYPSDGKTLGDLRRAHAARKIRTLSSTRPDLPPPLLEIVDRAIDRDQAMRPASAAEVQAALATVPSAPIEAPRSPVPRSRVPRWWALIAASVGAMVILLVGTPLMRPAPVAPPAESIAVLPIRNLTGDPAQQYLADGLTEVLVTHLARMPGLQVASTATTALARGASDTDRMIADKLGVRLLLAGSVLQAGDRIGLSVQLIDPQAGRTIWGSELQRDPSTILSARSEIASLLAARLSLTMPGAMNAAASRQLKAEAQDAYLRALVNLTSGSDTGIKSAVDLLARATAIEPAWAEPLAHLALAQQMAIRFGDPSLRDALAERAKATALRAIQLDASLPVSYTALAAVQAYQDWDFPAAEATLRQGIAAFPGNAPAYDRLALLLAAANRLPEAIAAAEVARDQEPMLPERHITVGTIRYYSRDFDGGLAAMQQALALSANNAPAHFGRGRILAAAGRYDEAIDSLSRAIEIAPNPDYVAFLGSTYAMAGRNSEVPAVESRLREFEAGGSFASIDHRAFVAAHQGRIDEAFSLLDEAVNRRMTNVLWLAVDPQADPLRGDPRFARLLSRIGVAGK